MRRHWGIPITRAGKDSGDRIWNGLLIRMGKVPLETWCGKGSTFDSKPEHVTCGTCLEALYRRGLLVRPGYAMPLFERGQT